MTSGPDWYPPPESSSVRGRFTESWDFERALAEAKKKSPTTMRFPPNKKCSMSRRRPLTAAGREVLRLYEEQRADRQARNEAAEKMVAKFRQQFIKNTLDKIYRSKGEAVTRDEAARRLGGAIMSATSVRGDE
jgi:hypothetical protein